MRKKGSRVRKSGKWNKEIRKISGTIQVPAFYSKKAKTSGYIFDLDYNYTLSFLKVPHLLIRLLIAFKTEEISILQLDRRPLFESLTGKRALGLSPPLYSVSINRIVKSKNTKYEFKS